MVYPHNFYRLVIGGTIYTETWNTSLSYSPVDRDRAIDGSILATVASAVSTWFSSATATATKPISTSKLTYIKLNRINPAGHYADPTAMTHIYPSPVAGGGTTTAQPAPQLATVVTLRTAFDRGRASRGRMYLPLCEGFVPALADGRVTAAEAIRVAGGVSSLINNVNAAFSSWGGGGDTGHVAVMSNVGVGDFHFVTRVQAGRVIDTMRSRRSSLSEDYQNSTIAIS